MEVAAISRVTKDPLVRQAELMDTALDLFLALGYQKTTVQDIVKKVNVAQGTFYYYFSSKEAILEAIIERNVKNLVEEVHSLEKITGIEKLQQFINRFYKLSYIGEPGLLGKILYKEKQGLLINKLWRQTNIITTPLLTSIIEECNKQGLTNVTHIKETLWFFGGIMGALLEVSSPLEYGHESDLDIVRNKLQISANLFETLFGAPAGSIKLEVPKLVKE
ncbi:TetR/AcrR family transcriptional regulator [Dendrosporobacter sp. 1207_IL3150]|uniref:TetR/AcrR family transcriptional regulator n=1 Tax=Dendrosporobacter sp. 1207_IL3150 TaxID=3084054 RepID=UPI002FD948C3